MASTSSGSSYHLANLESSKVYSEAAFGRPLLFQSAPLNEKRLVATVYSYSGLSPLIWPDVTLLCRKMLLTGQQSILVFPVKDQGRSKAFQVWIITDKEEDQHNQGQRQLKAQLEAASLTPIACKSPPEPKLLEAALQFTIQARLAPLWNVVGIYLMEATHTVQRLRNKYCTYSCAFKRMT